MNRVLMTGSICSGIDDKTTDGGVKHARFRIAVTRRRKDAEGKYPADFFSLDVWRTTAEFALKYLNKGDKVAIVGTLQNREWTDKEGQKKTVTEIIVDDLEKLSRSESHDIVPPGFTKVENETEDDLPFD